jgi:hypothetical protein
VALTWHPITIEQYIIEWSEELKENNNETN